MFHTLYQHWKVTLSLLTLSPPTSLQPARFVLPFFTSLNLAYISRHNSNPLSSVMFFLTALARILSPSSKSLV